MADVKQYGLTKSRPGWLNGEIYMPYAQSVIERKQFPSMMTLVLRTAADRVTVANGLRSIAASVNPDVPVSDVRAMKTVVSTSLSTPNSTTWLFAIFAVLALLLGAVGIYSLISYSVAERTHEIGVRMALGASGRDVLKLVVGKGMFLTFMGIGLGVAAALGLTRFLASLLYGVEPLDLTTFVVVPLVLSGVALLASYIPARRATKVDPMVALRSE